MAADTRATLGRQAREATQERYSYDAWLSRWKEAVGIDNGVASQPEASADVCARWAPR
jgi:hypothetical protein